jgi:acetyltransferase-like isoleucine patch superfamily enzyme
MIKDFIRKVEKKIIYYRLKNKKTFIFDKVNFIGFPIVEISNDSTIIVSDNVTLNSKNNGYHANMYAPVKLISNKPGSEIIIGEKTRIHGSCIHARKRISIGKRCLIAANCQIIDSSGHDASFEHVENRINTKGNAKEIVIEDDVWIGLNCIILPGVTISKGSIIGAGSVVTKSIPAFCIAAGNPCKVIRKLIDD